MRPMAIVTIILLTMLVIISLANIAISIFITANRVISTLIIKSKGEKTELILAGYKELDEDETPMHCKLYRPQFKTSNEYNDIVFTSYGEMTKRFKVGESVKVYKYNNRYTLGYKIEDLIELAFTSIIIILVICTLIIRH